MTNTFVAHVVVKVEDPKATRKQIRAYVQDAMDKYDAGYFGNDIEPVSVTVRRDVDVQ